MQQMRDLNRQGLISDKFMEELEEKAGSLADLKDHFKKQNHLPSEEVIFQPDLAKLKELEKRAKAKKKAKRKAGHKARMRAKA